MQPRKIDFIAAWAIMQQLGTKGPNGQLILPAAGSKEAGELVDRGWSLAQELWGMQNPQIPEKGEGPSSSGKPNK